jgi:hypothetical protein
MGDKRVHPRQKANHRLPRRKGKRGTERSARHPESDKADREDRWLDSTDDLFSNDILVYGDYGDDSEYEW